MDKEERYVYHPDSHDEENCGFCVYDTEQGDFLIAQCDEEEYAKLITETLNNSLTESAPKEEEKEYHCESFEFGRYEERCKNQCPSCNWFKNERLSNNKLTS